MQLYKWYSFKVKQEIWCTFPDSTDLYYQFYTNFKQQKKIIKANPSRFQEMKTSCRQVVSASWKRVVSKIWKRLVGDLFRSLGSDLCPRDENELWATCFGFLEASCVQEMKTSCDRVKSTCLGSQCWVPKPDFSWTLCFKVILGMSFVWLLWGFLMPIFLQIGIQ